MSVSADAAPRRRFPSTRPSPSEEGVFRHEGDYWTSTYGERTVRVRDGRGLGYLAQLLRHPGRKMPATFLAGGQNANGRHADRDDETVVASDLGDAGPLLDARAAAEYRRRAVELHAELAEAEARNDLGQLARIRGEIELLRTHLAALHGGRRTASHAERAPADRHQGDQGGTGTAGSGASGAG